MSDGFVELIDFANGFFAELKANNNRAWYELRKADYTAKIKKPAELLADLLAEDLQRMASVAHKPKVFRIHRDVRFSKDKTPYNTHLHLMWSQPREGAPAWFFGSAPDYLIMGMGLMAMQKDHLARFRAFVDSDGDDLQAAIQAAMGRGAQVSDWGPEPLKRVPKPYDQEHPHSDLLRRKALAMHVDLGPDWRDAGLIEAVKERINVLLPIWRLYEDGLHSP